MARRKGVALVYATLSLSTFLGVTALVVDLGNLYTRRAQAQRAADAAALAAASVLANGEAAATIEAQSYAKFNGYDHAKTLNPEQPASAANSEVPEITFGADGRPNTVRVRVLRKEPLYFLPAFAALLGRNISSSLVGATAVAQVGGTTTSVSFPLTSTEKYDARSLVANPSIFGPYAEYQWGDPYSPRSRYKTGISGELEWNDLGRRDLPSGRDFKGFDYSLDVSSDFAALNSGSTEVQLEIFDPDTYSVNGANGWDEIRPPQAQPDNSTIPPERYATTTEFLVYAPGVNPDAVGATPIATYVAGPGSEVNDLKWTTPPDFVFNTATHGTGRYTIRVKATDGSSENGFAFRAGRKRNTEGLRTPEENDDWEAQYYPGETNGTTISALDRVPLNFSTGGAVTINLGKVPAQAKGGTVFIDKFDTDVGYAGFTYTVKNNAGTTLYTFSGQQAQNATWAEDAIPVPADYPADGANWFVTYNAGAGDTSTWNMRYQPPNAPASAGNVRLVQ
jgi:Flp pilus assembly protein TadG